MPALGIVGMIKTLMRECQQYEFEAISMTALQNGLLELFGRCRVISREEQGRAESTPRAGGLRSTQVAKLFHEYGF